MKLLFLEKQTVNLWLYDNILQAGVILFLYIKIIVIGFEQGL